MEVIKSHREGSLGIKDSESNQVTNFNEYVAHWQIGCGYLEFSTISYAAELAA